MAIEYPGYVNGSVLETSMGKLVIDGHDCNSSLELTRKGEFVYLIAKANHRSEDIKQETIIAFNADDAEQLAEGLLRRAERARRHQ